jgi:hypothetical protein
VAQVAERSARTVQRTDAAVAALTAVVHAVQSNSQQDVARLGTRLDVTDADVSAVSASIVAVEERLRAAVTAGVSPLSAALAAQRRAVSTCTLQFCTWQFHCSL